MSRRQGVAGYILAGGESSRMGRDKALLVIGGAPLVGRTAALVALLTGPPTIIGAPERYESFGYRVIGDDAPGLGPLGGIATALRDSRESWNLIVGCDLPFLTNEWLAYLIDRALRSQADAVVPQSAAGAEPLCAMYRKHCEPSVREAILRGVRKVMDGFAAIQVEGIPPEEWKSFDPCGILFKNVNSPQDFEEAGAVFKREYERESGS